MSLNNHSFSSLFKNEKIIENKRVKILNIDVDDDLRIRFIESHLQIAINNPQFKLNQIQKKPFEIV